MESGTAGTTGTSASTNGVEVGGGNGASAGPEEIRVNDPATDELIETLAVDSAESVAAKVARVRANQADWEAMGIEGRRHWLGKLRDWLLDNQDRVLDTMQRETGKVRADASNEPVYLADTINFYGARAAEFIGEESVRPHSPLLQSKKLRGPVPAAPGRRHHQPLELPADPLARRRDPGAAGGRRGRHQALRVHAAGPGRGRRGLEARDRRPRRPRRRPGHRRDRRRPRRRRRLRPVHRLRPHRPQGDGARRRDADPGQPRARRQGPDDRARRRRRRARRQRRRLGRDVQLRPGLHLGRAGLRRGAGLRRVRGQAERRGRRPAAGLRRRSRPQGRRRDDLAQPDRRSSRARSTTPSPTAPGR